MNTQEYTKRLEKAQGLLHKAMSEITDLLEEIEDVRDAHFDDVDEYDDAEIAYLREDTEYKIEEVIDWLSDDIKPLCDTDNITLINE